MLKLGRPQNAYDLLGLPRSVTPIQIRARFRHLARSYKKELGIQDLLQDDQFRRWVNAYLQLTGPDRKEYDRRLRQSRGREEPADMLSRLPEARVLLVQAELALVRRKLNDGVELARQAVKLDPRNAEGYALLGDLAREQGRYDQALTMYNYAIQFDPNNRRYWQLLQEVTALRDGRALPRRYRDRRAGGIFGRPPVAWAAAGLTVVLAGLAIAYARQQWGEPVMFNIPRNLLIVAAVDGFLMGMILAAAAVIGPFDDELVWYSIAGFGPTMTPVGLFVAVPGLVFFWLAPVFYAVCAWLDEHLSMSIVIALGWCALLTVVLGLLGPPEARNAVYALSGNVAFFGFLCGWLIGSIRRRVFEH